MNLTELIDPLESAVILLNTDFRQMLASGKTREQRFRQSFLWLFLASGRAPQVPGGHLAQRGGQANCSCHRNRYRQLPSSPATVGAV
uniref:Transposase n=1 Tax=Macrostomum lignano TaxID=282301 RepID=A0A1I8FKD7_9PLAT